MSQSVLYGALDVWRYRNVPKARRSMLSIAEVAAAVGRTAKWVLARAATGDLPAVKVGGKIFIKRTELEAILGAPIELLEERDALDNPQHEGGNA